MATLDDDLNSFNQFVRDRSGSELELSALFDLWMLENASDLDYAENVNAINASIADFLAGERGTPAGEHSERLRAEFGLHD